MIIYTGMYAAAYCDRCGARVIPDPPTFGYYPDVATAVEGKLTRDHGWSVVDDGARDGWQRPINSHYCCGEETA